MVMHSSIYAAVAAADRLPSCPDCGYYLTATDDGLVCTRCHEPECNPAQSAALAEYIAAREEWEGLRDDIAFANSFAEKDAAAAQLPAAQSRYGAALREADRLGVLAVGRRMFC